MFNLVFTILLVSGIPVNDGKEDAHKFPANFLFGASTSAYQIEGGNEKLYGKGENMWDFSIKKNPFIIANKSNAEISCDSYHKYRNDIELLKYLGVNFYRFSISWSRLLPDGYSNKVNTHAVRYYNDVINLLLMNGIEPMVTLHHKDLPQKLQEIGGWTNPYLAYYYEDYARIVFTYFGDRVKYWITFNEICVGYGGNIEPPFLNQPEHAGYLCRNVILLAHAKAYHLYDQVFRNIQRGQVGYLIEGRWLQSATEQPEDLKAAERARQFFFGLQGNAVFHPDGDFPEVMKRRIAEISKKQGYLRSRLPDLSKEEVTFIQGTYDFLAVNYYSTVLIKDSNTTKDDVGVDKFQNEEWKKSASEWLRVYPDGLRNILRWVKDTFDNPEVFITENGFSDHGELNDTDRVSYLKLHLEALLQAIYEDKIPVKGYSVWSLLDNFEWMAGYTEKFGLFHVNFNDPQRTRTTKLSAKWYKKVIAERTPSVVDYY
ncbi:hypothetical protein HHI36_021065 [Cryptolaemus montrouzieri]|uniref:beta-glucosidase n=1 Tax=Cryptolaemus montrouzieri TaxID=559131 RepID=A0ABD2MVU1_9CUCU